MMCVAMGDYAAGQHFRHPQPGDIYKEYKQVMLEYYQWRVTDPNATNSYFDTHPEYLTNTVLYVDIDDLVGAVKAEAVIDLWQGHTGTTGKKMRVNGNSWIDIPELTTTPTAAQCYYSQSNVTIDIPLSHLVTGTNSFEGTNDGQTCYDFGWGQHGWNGIIFRIYYDASKAHPTGSITSPTTGGSIGEWGTVTATASASAGVAQVDFIGYYYGPDLDGDGVYTDWQYYYHRGHFETSLDLKGHIGTDYSEPYEATWNNQWIPNQPSGMKVLARIKDNNGVWYVTDAVENVTFSRGNNSVEMFPTTDTPEDFDARAYSAKQAYIDVPSGTDLASAYAAKLVVSTWNSLSGGIQSGESYYYRLNGYYFPAFGEDHFWSLDWFDVPLTDIATGSNTYEMYSESQSTEIFTHWPGPTILVRWVDLVPVQLSSFTATVLGAEGVKLEWKTLTETDNLGFEVQRSETPTGPFTTLSFVEGHGTILVPQEYSYTDASVTSGIYYYRLNQIDRNGAQHPTEAIRVDVTTGVVDGGVVPVQSMLAQNYPNPFNPSTTIRYGVAEKGHVSLAVYTTLGEKVAELVNGEREAGYYDVKFDARHLAAGVYFYRLVVGNFVQTNKLLLVK